MCGIVGGIAERDVVPILMEGLRRLEYRGYDSAGLAIEVEGGTIERRRTQGKVQRLQDSLDAAPLRGNCGIAHTRWATHGVPSERNAHPQVSGPGLALVHNGIIENHEALRRELQELGYVFESETDTEVVAHRIRHYLADGTDLHAAVKRTVADLEGAYALAVISSEDPDRIVVARAGCPVVLGLGIGENFVASDVAALLPVTRRFIFLEEGDIALVTRQAVTIEDAAGRKVQRAEKESALSADAMERGQYRHFMQKEIHEQPRAVAETLSERIGAGKVLAQAFGPAAEKVFESVRAVQIVACGTSYHAGMVARYFIEKYARIPCMVEIASEYRYRQPVVPADTLYVTISQSGETLDTLEALRAAKKMGYLATVGICNVPESALVRESDLVLMTRAGPEIGVASTKAFTTQLAALSLLGLALARRNGLDAETEADLVRQLAGVPALLEKILEMDPAIELLAERFVDKHNALFLGRGIQFPVALEGALKLKEISYIHAEAYPAGELKHGPLALVDDDMPVIIVAPNNELLEKLKANMQEVRARGGELFVFADPDSHVENGPGVTVLEMPAHIEDFQAPIAYTVPLQLLSYHVAVLKGTDVDQPRNLAKSVTVE
ncbi:glutamine--fructose-6-phosphate transaminase (isomerizing) [Thioalkalivibrio sp. XN279]|uniref:glutamine--fructose-6-phosphate transaminase (isomerizing) n=1 Tax=Thioalkalivibrio sp. XN279 TaxID=2714953 RepID=UPI001408F605|nr:glutamine--fructose-6-phosphate transaminase (isomerizing) [Thioalkalivibrio sp. XN279]NHA15749.1 glutamine--fructose-6-phosphate transaminase (isomerizing) [Thioalkalivibrio sp. XN279]